MLMGIYGNNKRSSGRTKREIMVGLKTTTETKQVYTIDLSHGGVRVGGARLQLPLGALVELVLDKGGEKIPFSGRIAREDGIYYINRIGRDANAFFIKITDARFPEFMKAQYQVV
jgi:hypothetical protein